MKKFSKTVCSVLFPLPLVTSTVLPCLNSLAISHSIHPFTFIDSSTLESVFLFNLTVARLLRNQDFHFILLGKIIIKLLGKLTILLIWIIVMNIGCFRIVNGGFDLIIIIIIIVVIIIIGIVKNIYIIGNLRCVG